MKFKTQINLRACHRFSKAAISIAYSTETNMPFGLSRTKYLKVFCSYCLAAFAGSEVVHRYYRPNLTIPDVPPKKGELKTELFYNYEKINDD